MSPLPAADTSSQTATRPGAPADDPTGRGNAPAAAAKTKPRAAANRTPRTAVQAGSGGPSIDEALGAPMRQFTTRAAEDVLALLRERAEEIAAALPSELRGGGPGGALRMVVTDALIHALELDLEQHAERVRNTRGRELLSQAQAKIRQ